MVRNFDRYLSGGGVISPIPLKLGLKLKTLLNIKTLEAVTSIYQNIFVAYRAISQEIKYDFFPPKKNYCVYFY